MHPNFCVSSENEDLEQTDHPTGDASVVDCKAECTLHSKCSAIEWYESGGHGSKCKMMLTDTPATGGKSGDRFKDSTCYIKPVPGKSSSFWCMF